MNEMFINTYMALEATCAALCKELIDSNISTRFSLDSESEYQENLL